MEKPQRTTKITTIKKRKKSEGKKTTTTTCEAYMAENHAHPTTPLALCPNSTAYSRRASEAGRS
jgi:hypothetical protein